MRVRQLARRVMRQSVRSVVEGRQDCSALERSGRDAAVRQTSPDDALSFGEGAIDMSTRPAKPERDVTGNRIVQTRRAFIDRGLLSRNGGERLVLNGDRLQRVFSRVDRKSVV